jgi:SAM-dependent methyltransferase
VNHSFCTLFDRHYLTRGVALYRSLERTTPSFRLWAFCMDEETEDALHRLDLPSLVPVPLAALEEHDPALRSTKGDRTQVEYCWTATPAVCRYVLETQPDLPEVTYLDADLMFFSDPQPLFDELGSDAVLIVPHRYASEYRYKEPTSGTYNVEWLTFRRDEDGLAALSWWHERCIEWCYFRWEDGKLGDQKYLDDFPRLFSRVHVLEHPGGGLAPWNVTAHELSEGDGTVLVDGLPLVFYHHHSLRLYRATLATRAAIAAGRARRGILPWATNYPVSSDEERLIWTPYLRALAAAADELAATAPGVMPPVDSFPASELLRGGLRLARRLAVTARGSLARRLPGALERHRDSWRSRDVAAQMLELTESQLREPGTVPPYESFLRLLPSLLEDPELPRPARFLDIGCGIGAYGELLDRYAPGRFDYVGADYSEEILTVARERAPGRRFEQRDLLEPGALDGFDVVFASALLDVLPESGPALHALLGADARLVLLHRQQVSSRRGHVEVVPGYRGQRTYRTTITHGELESAAFAHGRRVEAVVDVEGDIRSFLLVRDVC